MTITITPEAKADILATLADAVTDQHKLAAATNELCDKYGLLPPEIKELVTRHGWPRPESMRHAATLILNKPGGVKVPQRPADEGKPGPKSSSTPFGSWADKARFTTEAPAPAAAAPVDDKPDPYIAALPVDDLFADPTYQRDLDQLRVQRMAADYRIALVGIIEVSKRTDGCYAILDGQHRWATVRDVAFDTDNENPHVPCRVHESLTVTEEAALYHQLNTTRKQLTGWDRWLARRGAGDQSVLDIEACVRQHGLVIGMGAGPNILRATKACENVVDLGDIELLSNTLAVVRAAYRDDQAGLDGAIIHGVAHVLSSYAPDELDLERLIEALSGIVPRQLTARASAVRELHQGTMDRLAAHVVVERYNATKGSKLQPFFERVRPLSKTQTRKVKGESRVRQAMLEWAKRTGFPGRHDRVTPTLKKAYAEAHAGSAA